jgi:hypothetical protein
MAEEGAPRGAPPPRPASRASSDAGSPPAGDTDDATSRAHRRRASTLDAHRDKSADEADAAGIEDGDHESENRERERDVSFSSSEEVEEGVDDHDDVQMLHDKLLEFRVENDALGEATTALRRALRRATEENAETRAALALAKAELEDERAASKASRAKAEEEATRTRVELGDVERLALELQGELEEARARAAEEARARRDAENASAAARDERDAAAAMADSLRDALADAARDAETAKAKAKAAREKRELAGAKEKREFEAAAKAAAEKDAGEALGEELREARAAAERAAKDRDAMASTWRREWACAKADHASELRATRARIANAEADLAASRASLQEARDARAAAESALAEATLRARDATRDRDGAVASLRALAEHEDAVREDAAQRAAVVGRLRDDAAEAASRCEALVARCASLTGERDAAARRAERAEADLREMAELAETVAVAQTENARRRAERASTSYPGSSSVRPSECGSPESPEQLSASPGASPGSLLRAAVRESRRSPNAFAASMAATRGRGTARAKNDAPPASAVSAVSAVSARSAPDPSTPATPATPATPNPGTPEVPASERRRAPGSAPGSRWIRAVGDAVAEELVHALAREVAELRDAADGLRADAADARAARDDARRALLEETTRARSLERARVLDLRETRAAERRAHAATETAWALRDKLALAAVETVIYRRGDEVRGDDEKNKQKSVFREDEDEAHEDEDEVHEDEDEVHEFEVEDEFEVETGRSKAPASEYFREAGRARVRRRKRFLGREDVRAVRSAHDARRRRAARVEGTHAESCARAARDVVFADVTTYVDAMMESTSSTSSTRLLYTYATSLGPPLAPGSRSRDDVPPAIPRELQPRPGLVPRGSEILRVDPRGRHFLVQSARRRAPRRRAVRVRPLGRHESPLHASPALFREPRRAHELGPRLRRGLVEVHRVRSDVVPDAATLSGLLHEASGPARRGVVGNDAETGIEIGTVETGGGTSARPRRGNGSPPGKNASVCVKTHLKFPMIRRCSRTRAR